MKDTLRDECDDSNDCLENCCINQVLPLTANLKKKHILTDICSSLLCCLCTIGPVCPCQCGCCSVDEALRRDPQAGYN